jgi:hypothetical protein
VSSLTTRWRLFLERRRGQLRSLSLASLWGRLRRRRFGAWYRKLAQLPIERDTAPDALRGWAPIRVDPTGDAVGWLPGERLRLRRGLFYETLFETLASGAVVPARRTSLSTLRALGAQTARRPDGFVFHVSRCGSTLLGNMLLASPRNLVLQEAEAVNALLRDFDGQLPDDAKAELLRGVLEGFDRSRPREGGRLFVKFSSWNVLQLPLIRRAFPDVPWVFLYRDPVEVVVSNLLDPGTWVRDQTNPAMGRHLAGAGPEQTLQMSRLDYCARVIGRYAQAALEHADARCLFLEYGQLTDDGFRRILAFFGCDASEGEIQQMAAERSFYSKGSATKKPRAGDRERKQRLGGADVREAVARHAGDAFEALSRSRTTAP